MTTASRLKVSFYILVLVLVLVASSRLVGLHWDAPVGLSWSTDLLSDEGFYCRNAFDFAHSGQVVQPGDFNSALWWPFWPIIQGVVLKLTSPNLLTARALSSFAFVLAAIIAGYVARKAAGRLAEGITLGFLLCSHMLFGFSRLALLEIPVMLFGMAAIGAHLSLSDRAVERRFAAMAFLGMGLLTKTTAVAFAPALVLLEFMAIRGSYAKRALVSLLPVLGAVVIMGSLQSTLEMVFPDEVVPSTNVRFSDHVNVANLFSPTRIWETLRTNFGVMRFPMDVVFLASLLSGVALWRNPAVAGVLMAILSHVAMLVVSDYQPTRYFVPLLALHAVLAGVVLSSLAQTRSRLVPRALAHSVAGLLVAGVCLRECKTTVEYLRKHETSIYAAAISVRTAASPSVGGTPDLILTDAPTLSLLVGMPFRTIDTNMCTSTIERRVGNFDQFVLVLFGKGYPEILKLRTEFSFETLSVPRVLTGRPNQREIQIYRLTRLPRHQPVLSGEGI